jgi:hypothetical protein
LVAVVRADVHDDRAELLSSSLRKVPQEGLMPEGMRDEAA